MSDTGMGAVAGGSRREWLRVREAATLLGMSPNTLRRAGDKSPVPCFTSPGGHRRYRRRDIEALLNAGGRGAAAPAAGTQHDILAAVSSVVSSVHAAAVSAVAVPIRADDEDLLRRVHDLTAVLDADVEISVALGRGAEQVYRTVTQRLAALAGVPVCEIYAVEGDQFRVLISWDHGKFDPKDVGQTYPISDWPTTERALRTGEAAFVGDLDDPQLTPAGRDVLARNGLRSVLSLPMVVRGEVIGIVELEDTKPHDFSAALDLAVSLTRVAAHAYDTAALVERVEERNRALRDLVELGSVVSSARDFGEVAEEVALILARATNVRYSEIYALEGNMMRLLSGAEATGTYSAEFVGWRDDVGNWAAESAAFVSREPEVIESLSDPRLSEAECKLHIENGLASEICVPLIVGTRVVGFLVGMDSRERDYADVMDFFRGAAQLFAGSLEKSLLLDATERHNEMLRQLVDVGRMATQTRDTDVIVNSMAERLIGVIDADSIEIYAIEDDQMHLLTGYDRNGDRDESVGWRDSLSRFPTTESAVNAREPLIVESLGDERLTDFERGRMAELGFQSEICVPLVVEDRVVGTIDVFDVRARDWTESRDFLQSVAPIVASALDNALLFQRLEESTQELRLLVDSGLTFGATLDLNEVLYTISNRMCEIAGCEECEIAAADGDALRVIASVKLGVRQEEVVGLSFRLADYTYWRTAFTDRVAVAVADVLADPLATDLDRADAIEWDYRGCVALPLMVHGEIIGLANLYSGEPRDWEHLDLLRGLGQIAAQAIGNASLFKNLDQAAKRLALVADTSLELSATLDIDEVMSAVARSLRESMGFATCDVHLLEDEGRALRCVARVIDGVPSEAKVGEAVALTDWPAAKLAVDSRAPVAVVGRDDPLLNDIEREAMAAWNEVTVLTVPLVAKGRVVAIVDLVDAERERTFSTDEIATAEAISRVAGLAIDNAGLYRDIKRMHLGNLKALSQALNAKDYYTLGHAARVAAYVVLLGRELGWDPETLDGAEEAAYLHDIGKIGVSDRVLLKPAGLNSQEWDLMRQHPIFSADIIRPLFSEELVLGVRHHHERFDGAGYPDGLAGEDVPLIARAMCVVDSYDAMSFRRPYRQAFTYTECLDELDRCRGDQFDPAMVDAFKHVLARLAERKRQAVAVAEETVARIDVKKHALIKTPADESRPEYEEIAQVMRDVRDANPPAHLICTVERVERSKFIVVVDAEDDPHKRTHVGTEIIADEELPEAFAGVDPDANVLAVDEWGVWVSGLVPARDFNGDVKLVVAVDMPPPEAEANEMEGLRSEVTQTFASMFQTAAGRLARAELDAITDGLTGLYNHRYLHERLGEEIERVREQGGKLALLFCDLDRFKGFNDRHGHSAGDRALRNVARLIERSVRHVDLAARYAGEEFAAILIDTDLEGALEVAERIRASIAKARLAPDRDKVTVSIGVAAVPADADSKEELIDKADWAMYLAKRLGRDRVQAFGANQNREIGSEFGFIHDADESDEPDLV
jgi:diguanylate cyclase (GGDEF)-like protein